MFTLKTADGQVRHPMFVGSGDFTQQAGDARQPVAAKHRLLPLLLLVGLGTAIAIGANALSQQHRRAAIAALPTNARAQIFHDSLRELRDNCLASYAFEGPVRRHCVAEAEFAALFPECDADCQVIVGAVLPSSVR